MGDDDLMTWTIALLVMLQTRIGTNGVFTINIRMVMKFG